jgi:hypothetical protein
VLELFLGESKHLNDIRYDVMSGVTDESSNYLGIDIQDASANDKTQILLSSFLYVLAHFQVMGAHFQI